MNARIRNVWWYVLDNTSPNFRMFAIVALVLLALVAVAS